MPVNIIDILVYAVLLCYAVASAVVLHDRVLDVLI